MRSLVVDAKPQQVAIDPTRAAVIVVDMQNDFGSKGGMFDRAGIDISGIERAVAPTAAVIAAARRAGIPIFYLKMAYRADLSDLGAPDAPNRVRHLQIFGVGTLMAAPDGREGGVLVRDTWGTDIVDALTPEQGDRVIYKTRFSGFYETELDTALKAVNARQLVITGCTTSVCVESTIRDAFFRDYQCVLMTDCTSEPIANDASRSNHHASITLIELLFGWTSTSADFVSAVEAHGRTGAVAAE